MELLIVVWKDRGFEQELRVFEWGMIGSFLENCAITAIRNHRIKP